MEKIEFNEQDIEIIKKIFGPLSKQLDIYRQFKVYNSDGKEIEIEITGEDFTKYTAVCRKLEL